jgi:hypothetical protein
MARVIGFALLRELIGRRSASQRQKSPRPKVQLRIEELEGRLLPSTYFVSPSGNDSNAGTSANAPWQTINRVDQAHFQAGDQILFQGGATFNGNLTLSKQDAGTAVSPITISSYGTGQATINAGTGTGIAVTDTQGITISNLVVVGSGYSTNPGNGIYFINNQSGVTLAGINVYNVEVSGFGHVGIHFVASNGGNFSGISVTDSVSHDNGYGGLAVEGGGRIHATNVYIGHVQAYHNAGASKIVSGYGIFVSGSSDVVVERSVAYDNGWLPGNLGETGGIEAIACNRVLLQYNEAYANHQGKSDGDGIILDVTTNSIMQYNYTHDNDGAGLFLGAEIGHSSSNNVVRYNISQNDARTQGATYGGLFVWANVQNSDIYNNTVFMGPSTTSSPAAMRILNFRGSALHLRDNIFITTGGVPVVAYNGGGTGLLFQGNDYWSSGASFGIQWAGRSFTSLSGWRSATGQEQLNGNAVGYQVDPHLYKPDGGGNIGNPDLLASLTAYQLLATSPLINAGLDLSTFGIAWDPYSYAADPFLSPSFNSTAKDFYGNPLPAPGSNLFTIGADLAVPLAPTPSSLPQTTAGVNYK